MHQIMAAIEYLHILGSVVEAYTAFSQNFRWIDFKECYKLLKLNFIKKKTITLVWIKNKYLILWLLLLLALSC